MEDDLLFMPPCCINKKLPRAIMQPPGRALVFYTHGDVTFEKLYRSVAYLVDGSHTLVLSMTNASTDTILFLQLCFERKWIKNLVLSTSRDCLVFLERYLSEYKRCILYVCDKQVSDSSSHFAIYSAEKALIITGSMFDRPGNSVSLAAYSAMFYPSYSSTARNMDWGIPLRNALLPDVLRHRQHVVRTRRKLDSVELEHFIHMEFPPYKDIDNE